MKGIRKILLRMLGLKAYLRLISKTYIICISYGLMRKKYAELYFLKKILKPGDCVLDIGANLGYYSFFMCVSGGKSARVIAVEPIPLFAAIWMKNLRSLKGYNYSLHNCTLGTENRDKVIMSVPLADAVGCDGLTGVITRNSSKKNDALLFEVPMKNGDQLMADIGLTRLDFVKCDMQSYGQQVLASLAKTIQTYRPVVQLHPGGSENRQASVDFLVNLGYDLFVLKDERFRPLEKKDIFTFNQDFYFIPGSKADYYKKLIQT